MFKIRNTKPTKNDLCYVMDDTGGWSWCIKGKPTDKECNVLANCVGYACGRFNEIINEIEGTTGMRYPTLNCNAENFIERAKAAGLEIVDYPVLGGIMVMQKGETLSGNDGAGHVFAVENILERDANGIPIKIYTSESAYKGSAFYNVTRSNANGRWGHNSAYSFRGCIVNPAVKEEPLPELKYKLNDKVIINGELYKSSTAKDPAGKVTDKVTTITRIAEGSIHPYNTEGDLGWMDEEDIKLYEEPTPTEGLKVGDEVKIIGYGNASSYGDRGRAGGIGWTRTILAIHKGKRYPYQVGSSGITTGFYKAEALKKI